MPAHPPHISRTDSPSFQISNTKSLEMPRHQPLQGARLDVSPDMLCTGHLGPCSDRGLLSRKIIHQVRPVSVKRGSDEKFPGLVWFDHQFLLLTHFTRQTRNWGTDVECMKNTRSAMQLVPSQNGLLHLLYTSRACGQAWADQRREQPGKHTDQKYMPSQYSSPGKREHDPTKPR